MVLSLLILTIVARAENDFLKTLPPADFAAAGLQKLTPEELARLEILFQAFKAGEMTNVRQQEEAKSQALRDEAEKKVAAAEKQARAAVESAKVAEAKARESAATKAEMAPAQDRPGWFTALLTLSRAGNKPEKESPLESRLVGDFSGWNGGSIFTLENGTRWIQQNKIDRHAQAPVLHSPVVKIKPASFGGFWLEIEGVNLQVRVVPLDLSGQK